MSGEQLITNKGIENSNADKMISRNRPKIPGRVDINQLMSKVRQGEKKQKKENLVFFGLIASVIVITGIIASL